MEMILYIFRYFLVSITCGLIFLRSHKVLSNIQAWNRFLLGATSSCLVISFCDYLLTMLWVGIPSLIIRWSPIVVSLYYLFLIENMSNMNLRFLEGKSIVLERSL